MPNNNTPGRPKATDNPNVVSLLVTSFHSGMTVRDACLQSGISHEAYYNRIRSDEQFADTMAKAQAYATLKARTVVVSAIEAGNLSAAKWWLERKAKDEFGRTLTVDTDDTHTDEPQSTKEIQAELLETVASITKYRDDMIRLKGRCEPNISTIIDIAEHQLAIIDLTTAAA